MKLPVRRKDPITGAEEQLCRPCGKYLPTSEFYPCSLQRRRCACSRCIVKKRQKDKTRSLASILLSRVTCNEERRGAVGKGKHVLDTADIKQILALYGHDPNGPKDTNVAITRLDEKRPITPDNAVVLTRSEMRSEARRPGSVLTPERVKRAQARLCAARRGQRLGMAEAYAMGKLAKVV